MTTGYVGLGNMGGALARRLTLQGELHVFDANPVAVQALAEAGATPAADLAAIGATCDVVFVCLPTSDHVRTVLFGPGGLGETANRGTIVIDQTTGDPRATRSMAAELAARGLTLIDAPVSGGAAGAAAGTIAIMVGASETDFARIVGLLKGISPNIFHAGGVGAGHTVKLVNNLVSGTQRLLTMEAIALAVKNDVDPAIAVDILAAGGARNAYLEKFMKAKILKGDLAPGFTLALAHKDVRLACQLGSETGVPMFLGNVTRELLQLCISQMGPQAEVDTAALVFDELAHTHMVPTAEMDS